MLSQFCLYYFVLPKYCIYLLSFVFFIKLNVQAVKTHTGWLEKNAHERVLHRLFTVLKTKNGTGMGPAQKIRNGF